MTNKKKATMEEPALTSMLGIIIFAIPLFAVLMFVRSCSSGTTIDEKAELQNLEEVLKRVSETEGMREIYNVELEMNSAIIFYNKGKEAIIINKDLNIPKSATMRSSRFGFTGNLPREIEIYKVFLDASPSHVRYHKVEGFIKQKANTCPRDSACLCFCRDIYTETFPRSVYNWEDAYLMCEEEYCLALEEEVKVKDNIFLKNFFENVDIKYRPIKKEDGTISDIQVTPDINTIFWEGGFIIMRTLEELSAHCRPIKPGTISTTHECEDVFKGKTRSDYEHIILFPTIAGYRKDFPQKYIDVEFRNEQGEVVPRLI